MLLQVAPSLMSGILCIKFTLMGGRPRGEHGLPPSKLERKIRINRYYCCKKQSPHIFTLSKIVHTITFQLSLGQSAAVTASTTLAIAVSTLAALLAMVDAAIGVPLLNDRNTKPSRT